jgi:hypothetical protein
MNMKKKRKQEKKRKKKGKIREKASGMNPGLLPIKPMAHPNLPRTGMLHFFFLSLTVGPIHQPGLLLPPNENLAGNASEDTAINRL